ADLGGIPPPAVDGTYNAAGLAVVITPGRGAPAVAPELEMGRCQFAIAGADDVVIYRRQESDIVAVLAAMQDHPRCVLVREESGVTDLNQLGGLTLQRDPSRSFVRFMEMKGLLTDVKGVPYNGITGLVNDPQVAIQAYVSAEPLQAQQEGVQVRSLMLSDIGWNPYSSVLVTTGKLIREQPELVRQVVQATRTGWQRYLADPTAANEAILADNTAGMTLEALEFGAKRMRPLAMPDGSTDEVGGMTLERWTELVDQMNALDPDALKVDPKHCFTTEFL
ncbi:MAG: ABC transporter substrate-binding protein, partial [Planctomycetota bacterium]